MTQDVGSSLGAARDPANLLAAAWLMIAVALQTTDGHYSPFALGLVLTGAGMIFLAARGRSETKLVEPRAPPSARILQLVLLEALVSGLARPPAQNLQVTWYWPLYVCTTAAMAAVVALTVFAPDRFKSSARAVFIFGLLVAFTMRLLTPIASPHPFIDVFVMIQNSVHAISHGSNPYSTPVPDIYGKSSAINYHLGGYVYFPMTLYFLLPAYWLLGDARYAYVVAEAIAVSALYGLLRDAEGRRWLVLLLLFQPRGLFVIEQAWTEPLIVGAFGVTAWLAARRPGSMRVSAAYGLLLSSKEYLVFFVLHGLLLERRPGRMAVAGLVGFATLLPFLFWDPVSFVHNALLFQLQTPFRPDGLTVGAATLQLFGWPIDKRVSILITAVVAIVCYFWFRRSGWEGWCWAALITTLTLFMFGSQAFCNYYYLIEDIIVFLLAAQWCAAAPRINPPIRFEA